MDFYLYSILLLLVICTCCITSFRSGRNEGLQLGIERSLQILIDQKIVYLDEDSEIHQYDSRKERNELARELWTPLYKQRIVKNKKKYDRKRQK